MPLCGHHPARQCVCSYALVKMRPGANRRLKIDTFQGRYKLSPIDLKENFPALLRQMRQSGNSIFNPIQYYSNTFMNANDPEIESAAWDYITTRCGILERHSRFGNVPSIAGRDDQNDLYEAFKDLQYEFPYELQAVGNGTFGPLFDDCLAVLDRICTRLGMGGYRKGIYVEVIEMGRIFAPFIAEVTENTNPPNPWIMWSFLESFYKLTASMGLSVIDKTLTEVLFATTTSQRYWIKNFAGLVLQVLNPGSYLAQLVWVILT